MKLETTIERLRREVSSGVLSDGGRLPAERELASRLGVSRGTLRRALADLEDRGIIWRGVGRGTYLRGHEPQKTTPAGIVLDTTNPTEVMEARLALEPELAAVAALRATPAEIMELEILVDRGRSACSVGAFEGCDSQFHRGVARTTGNSLLLGLFDALNAARDGDLWGRLKARSLTPGLIAHYSDEHRDVVDALRDRDREGAAIAMRSHLRSVRQNLLDT